MNYTLNFLSYAVMLIWLIPLYLCEGSGKCIKSDDGMRRFISPTGIKDCNLKNCPPYEKGRYNNCYCCNGPDENSIDGGWAAWSTWSECSSTRDDSMQYRIRSCTNPAPLRNGSLCVTATSKYQTWDYTSRLCTQYKTSGTFVRTDVYGACIALFVLVLLILSVMAIYIFQLVKDIKIKTKQLQLQQNEISGDNFQTVF